MTTLGIDQSGKPLIRKVALVHNAYSSDSPSGEDVVAEEECRLLEAHGLEVCRYSRSNDELKVAAYGDLALTALQTPWSVNTYHDMKRFLDRHRPDLVHVHNTFPLISNSVVDACHHAGVPCVATVHNYRFGCANGLLLRDGRPCETCLSTGSVLPGLRHRCYRNSLPATLVVATSIALSRARKVLARRVSAIIALTEFQKSLLVKSGVPADKVVVKPNFVQAPRVVTDWRDRDLGFLFVGRLSHEKGLRLLMEVWKRLGGAAGKLTVIGDGPLRAELQRESPDGVNFLGKLPRTEVLELIGRARALLFPSIWFETFGLTIVEAFSNGVPVIASRIGGVPEIVDDGVVGELVSPGDVGAWHDSILAWSRNPDGLESMGTKARERHRLMYGPEKNFDSLMSVYRRAVLAPRNAHATMSRWPPISIPLEPHRGKLTTRP
jgi:glycosyltransferase involved in cell wall biosynthesis